MDSSLKIVGILAVGFAFASLLGYFCQRIKLSPILGYLLAGYMIGPYSPGFIADLPLSEQLAEIGVILMLFGVGMHFKIEDLMSIKAVALPGALGQIFVSAVSGLFFTHYVVGWSLESGIIIGLSIGVASTVVLVRVLTDNNLLDSLEGRISVGWLIVEDIFTVAVLILLPTLAAFFQTNEVTVMSVAQTMALMILKFFLLGVLMFTWGHKIVEFILTAVARLRSHELFTITLISLIFLIATVSTAVFGTSIALGSFIAGMVIGQTKASHQASANSLPLKDVFAVVFFLAVGMLFNPYAIYEHWFMFVGILFIILGIKPLVALLIVLGLKLPLKVAFTVAIALAQIGEFSFILAEESMRLHLLPDEGYDVLIAAALVSIALNPLLFRLLRLFDAEGSQGKVLQAIQKKWSNSYSGEAQELYEPTEIKPSEVVLIGFGPIGQAVAGALEEMKLTPLIVEQNIDTVPEGEKEKHRFIFGDATGPLILETVKISQAKLLIITVPETATAAAIVKSALQINPTIRILTRVKYISEQSLMKDFNVTCVCDEEESLGSFRRAIFLAVSYGL